MAAAMASWLFAAVLFVATFLFTPAENADVTYNLRRGTASASSVCTTGQLCFNEDDCQDCSATDFSPQAAFDGDPTTRWSSSLLAPDTTVNLTVSFAKVYIAVSELESWQLLSVCS